MMFRLSIVSTQPVRSLRIWAATRMGERTRLQGTWVLRLRDRYDQMSGRDLISKALAEPQQVIFAAN